MKIILSSLILFCFSAAADTKILSCRNHFSPEKATTTLTATIVNQVSLHNLEIKTHEVQRIQGLELKSPGLQLRPQMQSGFDVLGGSQHVKKMDVILPPGNQEFRSDFRVIFTIGASWLTPKSLANPSDFLQGQLQFYCDECGGSSGLQLNLRCKVSTM